ncbi:hypothetical protein KAH55_14215 [bacterium]|nr:hypothetical protein [bacterium]
MKILHALLIFIMIMALGWGTVGIYYYGHFHIDQNGHVLFHAHPFQGESSHSDAFPAHHHSWLEMNLLAILTQVLVLLAGFVALVLIRLQVLRRFQLVHQNSPLLHFFYTRISRRGPPAVFFHA